MELVNVGGWRGARLPELRGEIYSKLKGLLGNVSPNGDSLIGQIIGVSSESDLEIVEAMGWLYSGFFISQGEGSQLDGAGEFLGLRRNGLSQSVAYGVYLLEPLQAVAAGKVIEVAGVDGEWEISASLVADPGRANGLVLEVDAAALVAGNTFVIAVNGKSYTTQFEDGDTSKTIIDRLYGLALTADAALSSVSTVYGDYLFVADGQSYVSFAFSDDVFNAVRVGVPFSALYRSETDFPVVDYGDKVSDDILILSNGSPGYIIEGDESYRARLQARANARRANISASRPGIKTSVLGVDGVSYCSVNTNRGIETDANGLPGKSIQVFVSGGADDDVAQAIYNAAAGEAGTHGETFGTATDGETTETIYFTRQAYQLTYVSASGMQWDRESTGQPADFYTVARTVIEDYFTGLIVGRDVFAKQIEARLMTAIPTLTDITVKVGTAPNPTETSAPVADGVIAVTSREAIALEGESL